MRYEEVDERASERMNGGSPNHQPSVEVGLGPIRRKERMWMGRLRRSWPWRSGALAAGLLSGTEWAAAQPPYLPISSAPVVEGPYIAGEKTPVGQCLKDTFIGRHDMFYEPPPG